MDYIIQDNLEYFTEQVYKKEGVKIDVKDIEYSFLDRIEFLKIDSDILYPDVELPKSFGVQRGYAGGGIHSGLYKTEIHHMPKNRQAKAARILEMFKDTFWDILKSIDNYQEEEAGATKEIWEMVTL
jgi:hypothetical protein